MSSFCIKKCTKVITQLNFLQNKRSLQTFWTRNYYLSKSISNNSENSIKTDSGASLQNKSTVEKLRKDIDSLVSHKKYSELFEKSQHFKRIYAAKQAKSHSDVLLEDDLDTQSMTLKRSSGLFKSTQLKKDLRDPNERIDELMPEDVEQKIDGRLKIPLSKNGRIGRNAFFYDKKISSLGRQGKTKEALAIFEEDMMVRDRVMPRKKTFEILLGQLAHKGHVTKCFQLFRKMKQLGLDPHDKCYTSLFNACANSFDKSYGLARASSLLNYMNENGVQSNLFTLKASMKAFALCGDLPTAFALMDDASQRMQLDAECFNHLLMACISDKSAGFNRAIQVWLKLKDFGIKPEKNTINLLLRCVRDCDIGRPQDLLATLQLPDTDDVAVRLSAAEILTADIRDHSFEASSIKQAHKSENIDPCSNSSQLDISHNQEQGKISKEKLINSKSNRQLKDKLSENSFLGDMKANTEQRLHEWWEEDETSKKVNPILHIPITNFNISNGDLLPKQSNAVQNNSLYLVVRTFNDLKKPEGRLALLGGPLRLLKMMDDLQLEPDVRTYSQLLACLPNDSSWEMWLLNLMEQRQYQPDVDFLNDIMIRRTKRDKETVKEILPLMMRFKLTPNMRTYAALALTCRTEDQAMTLIDDMKNANLEPTAVVMAHFINASGFKFSYKRKMLMLMEEMGHRPTLECIKNIEQTVITVKKKMLEAEKSDQANLLLTDSFKIPFRNFLNYYRMWLQRTKLFQARNPWDKKDNVGK